MLLRVTPGIRPTTHASIQTGQVDSKFGFVVEEVPRAVEACAAAALELRGLHAHIGSQILELDAFAQLAPVLAELGDWPLLNLGGGVTIYRVGTVKRIPGVRTYVAVDGGMSDNLRPMLYGARYEAEVADRFGGEDLCTVAGMHCESGDVLIRDVPLDAPRPGDVLVVPATGAYSHAMANNYNAVPRPPVIFCRDGQARVVVRRETYDDLTARDV